MVLPSWTHTAAHRGHQSAVEAECPSSDLARRLQATCTVGGYEEIVSASAALLVRPTRDSTGTALLALDLQPPVTERVYPYMYDEGGRYSITGNPSTGAGGSTLRVVPDTCVGICVRQGLGPLERRHEE